MEVRSKKSRTARLGLLGRTASTRSDTGWSSEIELTLGLTEGVKVVVLVDKSAVEVLAGTIVVVMASAVVVERGVAWLEQAATVRSATEATPNLRITKRRRRAPKGSHTTSSTTFPNNKCRYRAVSEMSVIRSESVDLR